MLLSALISPFHSFIFPWTFPSPPLSSPPPPFLSPSYITGYVCVSCRSYKALCAVCNHWKGVSCKRALGGVHRWQHHPPCSVRPSSLSCRPSTIHFCSSFLPFILHIHTSSSEISLRYYVICCNEGQDWLVSSTSGHTEENAEHGGGESMLLLLPSTDVIRQTILSNKNVLQSLS